MNEFERELKQNNIDRLDVVVEFIRDKRNEIQSLYIECFQGFNDKRYYVPAFIISKQLESVFKINFLVDTGAPATLLSWNEVPYTTLQTNLREDRMYTAMGGSFKTLILPECSLCFYANTGIYNLEVGDLGLSNYLTVDGRL